MKKLSLCAFCQKALRQAKDGFSLIEINMAILVLAGGVLAVMGIFPLSLRESQQAKATMRQTAFAEHVIGVIEAAAQLKTANGEPVVKSVANLETESRRIFAEVSDGPTLDFTGEGSGPEDSSDKGVFPDASDKTNRVYYKIWVVENPNYTEPNKRQRLVCQVNIQVTADNVEQKRNAFKYAPIYSTTVVIDQPYSTPSE